MLSRDIRVESRDGLLVPLPKAPGVAIFAGSIVCCGPDGLAAPGRAAAGLAFLGVAAGAAPAAAASVTVRRGCDFLLRFSPQDPVGASRLGRPCWVLDGEFVAGSDGAGTRSPAGIVTGLERGRCWVRVEPAGASPASAPPATAAAPISTVRPADVTITEPAAFIETAGFDIAKGIYLVRARYAWATGSEVTAAHGGLYYATDSDTLVQFNAYYNNGADSGSPTPDAEVLLVPADLSGVTFYVSWPGDSTTGSLTGVEIDFYLLAGIA